MLTKLVENLCYGMRPSEFLRQELTLNPLQRRTAQRIFVILVLFAILSVSTRMPENRVTAFFLAILLPQIILTSRMAMDTMALMCRLIVISILASLITLLLWQDQGWFRYPFAIMLIVLMMFHARKSRISNIVAIFYGSLVLYNTSDPVRAVDNSLWTFLIMNGAIVVSAGLIAFALWPQSALEFFRERVRLRLKETLELLSELADLNPGCFPDPQFKKARHTAGWTADALKHLDDTIQDHPIFAERKAYWVEAVMELDTLSGGLTDFQRLWLDADPPRPITSGELAVIQAIKAQLLRVQTLFESRGKHAFPDPISAPEALRQPEMNPLLIRQYLAVDRLMASLVDIYQGEPLPLSPPQRTEPNKPFPDWCYNRYWEENLPILLWSLKVAIACAIVTLLVISLDAGKVDTAILTTIVVADSTLGADVRKSIMRLTGALLGAVLGYLWLILGQPLADTIAGFLVTLAPFLFLCAWASATSPRINYAGMQMGLAFTMIVFAEFEPGTYLGTGWYRVLGILLGISVMGLVDYFLWPAKSVDMARLRLIQTLTQIRDNLRKNPGVSDLNLELSASTLRMMDSNLKDAAYFLDFARMEPGSSQPKARQIVSNTSALIQAVTYLSKIIESRHRLFLERRTNIGKTILGEVQTPLKEAYADAYDAQVQALRQQKAIRKDIDLEDQLSRLVLRMEALEAFKHVTEEERRYIDALIDLERKHVRAILALCDQINESAQPPASPTTEARING